MNAAKFSEVVTACGNIFRAHITVSGQEFTLEMGLDRKWVNIIDSESRCEHCGIDEDGDVISDGGEYVTEAWTEADWKNLTNAVSL